jgi:hypothetical protein
LVAVPCTSRHTLAPPPSVRPLPLSPVTPLPEPQPTAIFEPSQAHLHAGFLSLRRPLSATGKSPLLLLSPPPPAAPCSSHRPATRPLPPYFFSFSFCAAQQQVAHLFFPGLASSPPSVAVQPNQPAYVSSSVVVQFVEEQMQLQVHYIFLEQCIIFFLSK